MAAKVLVKARRRISDEASRAIRRDAKAGMTVQEMAAKYDVAPSTVMRHMIASPRERNGLTDFQLRDIRKMYKQGATTVELAERFHLSVERVRLACTRRRMGVRLK